MKEACKPFNIELRDRRLRALAPNDLPWLVKNPSGPRLNPKQSGVARNEGGLNNQGKGVQPLNLAQDRERRSLRRDRAPWLSR